MTCLELETPDHSTKSCSDGNFYDSACYFRCKVLLITAKIVNSTKAVKYNVSILFDCRKVMKSVEAQSESANRMKLGLENKLYVQVSFNIFYPFLNWLCEWLILKPQKYLSFKTCITDCKPQTLLYELSTKKLLLPKSLAYNQKLLFL